MSMIIIKRILEAADWEYHHERDNGHGIAQPEYWTHPELNGPFSEEDAVRETIKFLQFLLPQP